MRFLKLLAVLALLGAAGWQGALLYRAAVAASQKPVSVPTVRVARGDLPLTLASYGTLEAANTYTVRNRGSDTGIRGAEASLGARSRGGEGGGSGGAGGLGGGGRSPGGEPGGFGGGGRSRGGDPGGSGGFGGGGRSRSGDSGGSGGFGGGGRSSGGDAGGSVSLGGGGRSPGGGAGGSGGSGLTAGSRGGESGGSGGGGRSSGGDSGGGGRPRGGDSGGPGGFGGGGGRSFGGGGGFGGGRGDSGVESQVVEVVEDGLVVTKGQVVVQLDKTKFEKQLRDRKLAYENALAAVKRVEADSDLNVRNLSTKMKKAEMEQAQLLTNSRAEIEQAQAETKYNAGELDYRKLSFDRTDRLAKDRLVPIADAEQAELTVKRSEFAVTSGERQLESKQHSQRSAIAQGELVISDAKYSAAAAENKAGAAVENARYNAESTKYLYELTQKQLEWCSIRAPVTGLVVIEREWDRSGGTPRMLQPGDPVRPNQRLMQIIDLSRMRVAADMGEMDASQIKVGQPVRVWPRSAPDQVLKARVLSVSKLARPGDAWRRGSIPGKKTFRVVIEIQGTRPDVLRPGLTADFEIVQGQVTNVVRVPLQALFKTTKGTSVFVKKGGRFVARPVKIGQRNANYAVVLSGLKTGEEIAVRRPPAALLSGEPAAKAKQQASLFSRTLGRFFKT